MNTNRRAKRVVGSVEERFWPKVNKTDGCWLWTAAINPKWGYGAFHINGKTKRAHRVAWEIAHGPIPDGLSLCHKCDNPPCVNPDHMFLGTTADNARDMASKGRGTIGGKNVMVYSPEKRHYGDRNGSRTHPERVCRGESRFNHKLSERDVIDIRSKAANGARNADLSTQYGVTKSLISRVVHRRAWTHV